MFERLEARAARAAEARAAARRERIAARMAEQAPRDVSVAVEGDRVAVAGRGLMRRMLLDPALRWLTAEGRDG